jgi:hypothetical protein
MRWKAAARAGAAARQMRDRQPKPAAQTLLNQSFVFFVVRL